MMKDKTRFLWKLLGAILACFLVACGPGAAPTAVSVPLKVAWTYREGDYTLLIAQEQGYFRNRGVEVEPILYEATSRAIPDMAGAEIDGGLLNMGELILASSVSDLRGVMVYDSGPIYSIVSTPDITTVTGLRGKRLGVNLHASSGMFVSYMLERALLTSRQVNLVEMSPEQVVNGIPEQIDAGLVWEPFTSQALAQGDSLLFSSNVFSAVVPGLIVFRSAVIEQHPDQIRAFLQAWNDAVDFRKNHPQEALDLIAQATGLPANQLGITGDDKLFTIDDNIGLFANQSGTDSDSIYFIAQFNLDYLTNLGDITNPPVLNTILDPTFLK